MRELVPQAWYNASPHRTPAQKKTIKAIMGYFLAANDGETMKV